MIDDTRPQAIGNAKPADHLGMTPSPWIQRFAHLVPAQARVLDLACGRGRHARLFAQRGCRVVAVDRDAEALSTLSGATNVDARLLDLEAGPWPLPGERFDAIVVTNYLHRPLFAFLLAALADDGVFLYETFARGHEAYGRPTNPDFLLQPDELLDATRDRVRIVAFEQGRVAVGGVVAVVQRLAALGRARAWPQPLAAE
jgi:SAM-dependent methyltransferase